jgi:speckle-type POZ protein
MSLLQASAMEHGRTVLTEAVRKVQLLKIDGYCATAALECSEYIKSKWIVDGHEWEVRFYPTYDYDDYCGNRSKWVALQLSLLSEPQRNKLKVNLSCRFVHPTRYLDPSAEESESHVFSRGGECSYRVLLMSRNDVQSSGYLVNDSLTVQCTITVLKELPDVVIPANTEAPLPPSDLHRHLGELWQGQRGADVTFVLESGERFVAHKAILAARSPVFMAEFFGGMNERSSQTVRIVDMDDDVFKAMLHFIYTDRAPQLDKGPEVAMAMAQHLLAAADRYVYFSERIITNFIMDATSYNVYKFNRYGLDRLKLICESKLAGGISIDTVATTLALAEQHNCSLLKAKCVDFIARSPETLDAVLATEGYDHLVESYPLVMTELLRAVHGRRI